MIYFILIALLFLLMIAASVYAIVQKDLLYAVMATGIISLVLSILYYLLQAPDVALTEAAIGVALTTIIFVIAIRNTVRMEDESDKRCEMKKVLVILLLAAFGFYTATTFFDIGFGRPHFIKGILPVKDVYLAQTVSTLKVSNAVTSIVVNFRGFDTLGEVTVLFLAVTALGSILYKKRHEVGERSVLFSASRL